MRKQEPVTVVSFQNNTEITVSTVTETQPLLFSGQTASFQKLEKDKKCKRGDCRKSLPKGSEALVVVSSRSPNALGHIITFTFCSVDCERKTYLNNKVIVDKLIKAGETPYKPDFLQS